MTGTRDSILVTGGAGFIGSHLVDRLLTAGARVTCVDDFNDFYDPGLKRQNVSGHLGQPGYTLRELDIREREAVDGAVARARPQVIVHLAARAGVRPSVSDPALYCATNIDGTLHVLEAARRHGVPRVIFGSSSSVYGLHEVVPFTEDAALTRVASPYAATKLAGEALCSSFAHVYGLSIVSLRFFTVYGPRQRPDLAIRKFAERMRDGQAIELYGDGSSSRDYTHVSDIVRGIEAAIDLDMSGHEIINLGNSDPITLRGLVELLEELSGIKARILWGPVQPGDVPRTYADIRRARERLGYVPATGLRAGLTDMLAWLGVAPRG